MLDRGQVHPADLIASLSEQCQSKYGFGSMSPSLYDTAWISMVQKCHSGKRSWLFPECFRALLSSQLPDGGWPSYGSQVDGILTTAAALLALKKHVNDWDADTCNLQTRCLDAERALRGLLNEWNVGACDQVGFEVLVVSQLRLLSDEGISIDFPGREFLAALRAAKLSKIPPSYVADSSSTLLHSLEALVGHVNFDMLRHQRGSNGSMLGSPASTAAYLMNCSSWDDDAETYLRDVLELSVNGHLGMAPCAWPTTTFELTWAITTLVQAGYPLEELGQFQLLQAGDFLEHTLTKENGVTGFAPSYLPDADDTSKAILALRYLGRDFSPDSMVATFEGSDCFRTYQGERNPSLSANCNVLYCLLELDNPGRYLIQIQKTIQFLCSQGLACRITDKWNLAEQYPKMLLTQTFGRLLRCIDDGKLLAENISATVLYEQIPIVSMDICAQTLHAQQSDGSWESKPEVTAYAILTLVAMSSFPWTQNASMQSTILTATNDGKRYLDEHRNEWAKGDYLWIEKVTYYSTVLSQVYCLAAAKATPQHIYGLKPYALDEAVTSKLSKFGKFFAQIPLVAPTHRSVIDSALIQGLYYSVALQRDCRSIFPRKGMADDKYLEYIPFIWTLCNMLDGARVTPSVMQDMMMISMLNYQADEFMEAVVGQHRTKSMDRVKEIIRHLCKSSSMSREEDGYNRSSCLENGENEALVEIKTVLERFIRYILQHPRVVRCHARLQSQLAHELETFLIAHITQAEHNARLARQPISTDEVAVDEPGITYYKWVRSTSSDHTSCPYSFVFYQCLISAPGSHPFPSAQSAYLSEDLCRHLAAMCRQYNDYGSIRRDRLEKNLNSVNFPEFHSGNPRHPAKVTEESVKGSLMWIAEYEREGLNRAMLALSQEADDRTMKALRLLVDVTDLFGQIYIRKDIASRMK